MAELNSGFLPKRLSTLQERIDGIDGKLVEQREKRIEFEEKILKEMKINYPKIQEGNIELRRNLEREKELRNSTEKNYITLKSYLEKEKQLRSVAESELRTMKRENADHIKQTDMWKEALQSTIKACGQTSFLVEVLADVAFKGHLEVVKFLVDEGVEVSSKLKNPRDDGKSTTPLHEAIRGKHLDVFRVLIALGTNVDTNELMGYAAKCGSGSICSYLMGIGTDVNKKDNNGCTPLHIALQESNINTCRKLIKAGANVNLKDDDGYTPLHIAAQHCNADICLLLISACAYVNEENDDGNTPIHLAAYEGKLDIVKILAENQADISLRNKMGQTAIECAQHFNHLKVIEYLKNK